MNRSYRRALQIAVGIGISNVVIHMTHTLPLIGHIR